MKKVIVSLILIGILSMPPAISAITLDAGNTMSEGVKSVLYNTGESFDGYVLFAPMYGTITYLINKEGKVLDRWSSIYHGWMAVPYLMENGDMVRADYKPNTHFTGYGGCTGRVEKFSHNGLPLWNFVYSDDQHCLHHDIKPLPNGNVLMIAWELKTKDQAINAGLSPYRWDDNTRSVMAVDYIIEVKPTGFSTGEIVWEWHVWDHLVQQYDPAKENYGIVQDHPELININYGRVDDFNHINSIDYNEEFDQILLSALYQNEIWIIDHSTTTEEAAGHTGGKSGKGGDILYRWGNPQAYGAGNGSDRILFSQHNARWIKSGCPGEGCITIFNNGALSVEEIVPPVDSNGNYHLEPGYAYGPEESIWNYTHGIECSIGGSAQRLPNGNTIICSSATFLEVTNAKEVVWRYENSFPLNNLHAVFSIQCYPKDYPGVVESSTDIVSETYETENLLAATATQTNIQSTVLSNQQNSQPISQQVFLKINQLLQTTTKTTAK